MASKVQENENGERNAVSNAMDAEIQLLQQTYIPEFNFKQDVMYSTNSTVHEIGWMKTKSSRL